MISDLVQQTIEGAREEFYSICKKCDIKSAIHFDKNNGLICSGILRYTAKETPFDKIRFCIKGMDILIFMTFHQMRHLKLLIF